MAAGRLWERHRGAILHWSLEIVVVTVGVLLALAVQEWAQRRAALANAAEAEERVRQELLGNAGYLAERVAMAPCIVRRLTELRDGVVRGGDSWRPRPVPNQPGEVRIINRVYFVPVRSYASDAFRSSGNSGALAALAPDKLSRIADIYGALAMFGDLNREELRLGTGLASLQFFGVHGAEQRSAVLADLARLDATNSTLTDNAPEAVRAIVALGYRWSAKESVAARESWSTATNYGRSLAGDCYDSRRADALYRTLFAPSAR